MSSSTALLPKAKRDELPIFLRVCHSPWMIINQKVLVYLRGLIAVYMTITLFAVLYYEIIQSGDGIKALFEFPIISYFMQVIYAWITSIWTFSHLNFPHHASAVTSAKSFFQKLLSPPHHHLSTQNRFFFSVFYTACVSLAHVVTLVYWLILVPHAKSPGVGDIFGDGWLKSYCILSLHGFNSVIAVIEVLVLCSIRRQEPIWAHLVGLTVLCLIIVGWIFVGKIVVGEYIYYFFDSDKIGWEFVFFAIVAFCGLSNISFAFVYGLTALRELLTLKSEDKTSALSGYTRLAQ